MFISKNVKRFLFVSAVLTCCLSLQTLAKGQIASDETVATEVETTDNRNFAITGGTQEGNNLFHSFSEFSVPNDGMASFENPANIQNIINRVTGGSISKIEGLIKAQGNANLLLINPNGIIFGANARLDIGGSFLGTTASSIQFTDGTEFVATNTQTTPLLTITAPIGLSFGKNPGSIVSRATGNNNQQGLEVKTGKTLALVGGDVNITEGFLDAPAGRIELGSVSSFSFVSLSPGIEGWTFGYETVESWQNIELDRSVLTTTGEPNGDINLQGKGINITSSQIQGFNFGTTTGGDIYLQASDIIEISNGSQLSNIASFNGGAAGEIFITTGKLVVSNNSTIDTTSEEFLTFEGIESGGSGNLTIYASESIEIKGQFSLLTTTTATNRKAGNIILNTERLLLSDGGKVSSSTIFAEGNGGNIIINASKVEITGQGNNLSNESGSGLFSQTSGETTTGDGGNITINTKDLNIEDGGVISVGSIKGSQGGAGSLTIKAQDIILDRGTIAAETNAGSQGNITIDNADTLLLRNQSFINTNAQQEATGGNITIDSEGIALLGQSGITANAVKGRGGNINITTQRLFREPDSEIRATSEFNIDGTIIIDSPNLDPTSGLFQLSDAPVDIETIFAQNLCKFEDEKIAKGSSFYITGRGGLTPTSTEPLDNLDKVINWVDQDDIQVSEDGIVGVRQRSANNSLEKTHPVIQQSQGWVTTSDGSVWLVANSPKTMPQNSQLPHPDCGNLPSPSL